MSRIKYILQAPPNASEALIEGTPYWPDDDGLIETTNPNHLGPLKLHGYKVVEQVALTAPQRAKVHGVIDIDDLGRTGLAEALTARGVTYPDAASRHDLADIATAWNKARATPNTPPAPRQALPEPQVAAPAPVAHQDRAEPPVAPPAAAAPVHASAPAKVEHDFSTYGYEDLKGWLSARGVAFQGNAAKKVLVGLASEHHAKTKTAELEAV